MGGGGCMRVGCRYYWAGRWEAGRVGGLQGGDGGLHQGGLSLLHHPQGTHTWVGRWEGAGRRGQRRACVRRTCAFQPEAGRRGAGRRGRACVRITRAFQHASSPMWLAPPHLSTLIDHRCLLPPIEVQQQL